MVDYLEYTGSLPEETPVSVMLCKTLIPSIGTKIKEWSNFPLKYFLIGNYEAHQALYQSVKAKLDSLIRENKRLKQEQEIRERSQEMMKQQQQEE